MIFRTESVPVKFYMKQCPMAVKLKKRIESQGGQLYFNNQEGCIPLGIYEPGDTFAMGLDSPPLMYSYRLIDDSIKAGRLLRLFRYRILEKLGEAKPKVKRVKFSIADDRKILEYVRQNPGSTMSVSYWEKATKKGFFTNHTADSLKQHWLWITDKRVKKNAIKVPKKRKEWECMQEERSSIDINFEDPIMESPCKTEQDTKRRVTPSEATTPERMPEEASTPERMPKDQVDMACSPAKKEEVTSEVKSPILKIRVLSQAEFNTEVRKPKNKIIQQFHGLVEEIRKISGNPYVREREVLECLIRCEGKSSLVKLAYEPRT
mmetsp:Transcript_26156/g.46527  ORF Transcript_26156/g.46527 Transcript_26156/m.46527 type:complete len:320 (-) Transcript_26156:2260-3219(-)|eukprot:CAMPEP_0204901054 /NCGR_PEP_ID=MMETSP1397-20131031/2848_1 /ASSEMBLY_ACC=CAM_ASM_000891 /TAXON_ID=49980 /ORGANISM="Climacostomum Climacostomum virens, Strain Stock W-24" /LENGTH=319 /DNA_ID=CAMNT_0052069329 /DNA_START=151 /DNA_END=1110 /DNA_ORIENTATION=+